MAKSKKLVPYETLLAAMESLALQLKALRKTQRDHIKQKNQGSLEDMTGMINGIAKAISEIHGEIRKTSEDAKKAVEKMPPDKQAELILEAIGEMSPEHRRAIAEYIDELGSKLFS